VALAGPQTILSHHIGRLPAFNNQVDTGTSLGGCLFGMKGGRRRRPNSVEHVPGEARTRICNGESLEEFSKGLFEKQVDDVSTELVDQDERNGQIVRWTTLATGRMLCDRRSQCPFAATLRQNCGHVER
jgi:hypothetical protein